MTKNSSQPDDDEKIPHLENFLRPFEKLSREELDEMFAKAAKCIATEKQTIEEQQRRKESS
jgi:hypothetical protein